MGEEILVVYKKNFEEVFGSSPVLWFLPLHSDRACTYEERLRLQR